MKIGEIWRRKSCGERTLGGVLYANQLVEIIDIKYDDFIFTEMEILESGKWDEKVLDKGKDYMVYFYWLEFKYKDMLTRRLFLKEFEFVGDENE